jgi:hypothetical protein
MVTIRGWQEFLLIAMLKCSSDRIISTLFEIFTQAIDEQIGVTWLTRGR